MAGPCEESTFSFLAGVNILINKNSFKKEFGDQEESPCFEEQMGE